MILQTPARAVRLPPRPILNRRPAPTVPVFPRFAIAPVASAVLGLTASVAWAQAPAPLRLQPSLQLQDTLPESVRRQLPSFVSGQRIEGQTDGVTTVEGEAELRRHDTVIRADRLSVDQRTSEALAEGNVLINRNGDRYTGPHLRLNLDTFVGRFTQPSFELLQNGGRGDASRLDFEGEDRAVAHDARYSTCPRTPGADWMPDWLVRATRIEFDNVEQTAAATGGVLEFKGVPILGAPYFTFPLTDTRKSGLLPPTLNIDNISGLEFTLPYYLNIAPHLDATLYPTFMSKRGVDLGGELRYLQPDYAGQVRGAFMPSDQLRDADRWGYTLQHDQRLSASRLGLDGNVGLRLNLNRVSDDDYWRDFPRATTSLTTRLLASDAVYSWGRGPWSVSAGAYTWQTLQDIDAPITPPYDRLPSVAVRYGRSDTQVANLSGVDWSVLTEYTRFQSVPSLTRQTNGDRALTVAEISRRFLAPGWYVKPRAQLHATQYSFDSALANGSRSASRVLPTVSRSAWLAVSNATRSVTDERNAVSSQRLAALGACSSASSVVRTRSERKPVPSTTPPGRSTR